MALQPFVGPWPFFSFLILYTIGRTPWTRDQPVARPLPIHRATQRQIKRTQTSMPWVGFKPTIPPFEREKTVHALDRAAIVIGSKLICRSLKPQTLANVFTKMHAPYHFRSLSKQNGTSVSLYVSTLRARSTCWNSTANAMDNWGGGVGSWSAHDCLGVQPPSTHLPPPSLPVKITYNWMQEEDMTRP
jgi:hypothetical protein